MYFSNIEVKLSTFSTYYMLILTVCEPQHRISKLLISVHFRVHICPFLQLDSAHNNQISFYVKEESIYTAKNLLLRKKSLHAGLE